MPSVKQHAVLAFLECDLIGVAGPCALLRSAQADVDVEDVPQSVVVLVTPKLLPLAHLEHQPLGLAATCFAVGVAHKFLQAAARRIALAVCDRGRFWRRRRCFLLWSAAEQTPALLVILDCGPCKLL